MSATPSRPLAIAHTEASNGWGGQEIRILAEAAALRARGHDVHVYAATGARIVAEAGRFGVPVTALPIGRKRPRGLVALVRALARHPVDIVNAHSSTDAWLSALACRVLSLTGRAAPVLVRTRHVSVPVPNDVATRWLYRTATARVVTTGGRLREQLVHDNGLDPARVVSVPTGIDPGRFGAMPRAAARSGLGLPSGVPLIGIVATLRSWKGHRFLVEALGRLARRDARLVIVGDGPQRAALEAQVAELKLAHRVVFAGQQDDVAPWLAALDVFALPSYANEGVPQALMQAMACGLPVISTPVGSIAEIVQDGETGRLVAPEDAQALRAAIEGLLADPAARAKLARNARSAALQRFGEDRMVERMIDVFTVVARSVRR